MSDFWRRLDDIMSRLPDEEEDIGDIGVPQVFYKGGGGSGPSMGQPQFNEPSQDQMEEITVTAPRERGLVQLPQNLPNSGYYNYGTPKNGAAQYGLPTAMSVIGAAGNQWQAMGNAPFGVGNMSLSDGTPYKPHASTGDHTKGTGIDLRPIRTDGQQAGISWSEPGYDRGATQKLVDTLRATGGVTKIFFNDPRIKGVTYLDGHDNHLHVRVDPNYRRAPGNS
jgi:penicillin-insensitive murein endopeptidase